MTQGSRTRQRTQKNIRGQVQGPRTQRGSYHQKKKVFAPKIQAFSKKKMSSENFSQTLWRSPRGNKIVMTLAHFQQVKK